MATNNQNPNTQVKDEDEEEVAAQVQEAKPKTVPEARGAEDKGGLRSQGAVRVVDAAAKDAASSRGRRAAPNRMDAMEIAGHERLPGYGPAEKLKDETPPPKSEAPVAPTSAIPEAPAAEKDSPKPIEAVGSNEEKAVFADARAAEAEPDGKPDPEDPVGPPEPTKAIAKKNEDEKETQG